MALKDAVKKINDVIQDLSSLHVQTYTGEVNFTGDAPAGESKFTTVRDKVQELKNDNKITLVAEAYYQFDGDSYNFLASGGVSQAALEMHKAAVDAGIKTRQGLVELVQDIFRG